MTATKLVTIAGREFTLPQPYVPGHVLTEGEAKALNQVLAENIRNNMATKVKAAVEGTAKEGEPTIDSIDAFVSAYAASYEFNATTAGERRVTDPLEVEAISIAREILKGALKANGISYLKVPEEKRNAMVAEIAQKDSVVKEAKKRLDAKRKAAEAALDGIDLSGLGGEAEPETAPAAAE